MPRKRSLESIICSTFCLVLISNANASEEVLQFQKAQSIQRDARMGWWRDAKFGMFIHWGASSHLGGIWQDKKISNYSEWIMAYAQIPEDVYIEEASKKFNPETVDFSEWVSIAKNAGMKYLVITSKHHDGFCMFDSEFTDYDIMETSPLKRDVFRELSEECQKQGIVFCSYYSIIDWHHPSQELNLDEVEEELNWQQSDDNEEGVYGLSFDEAFGVYGMNKIKEEDKDGYIDYMKNQCRELIENYNPAVLWFDGDWADWWTARNGRDLADYLMELKPDLIINNRVGEGPTVIGSGDYATPEQEIPRRARGHDWETCMTMNKSFGYKSWDNQWKTPKALLLNLVNVVSKGGNYLLNVGPDGEGNIPQASVDSLEFIGEWMKVNSESVYGTKRGPIEELVWGRCARKTLQDGKERLYFYVMFWPDNGRLLIPGLTRKPVKSWLAGDTGNELSTELTNNGLSVSVPTNPPDSTVTVIAMDFSEELPETIRGSSTVEQNADGTIVLNAFAANLHINDELAVLFEADEPIIGDWYSVEDWVDWEFDVSRTGKYEVEMVYTTEVAPGTIFDVAVGNEKLRGKVGDVKGWNNYTKDKLGTIQIDETGVQELSVKPVEIPVEGVMRLMKIILTPERRLQ